MKIVQISFLAALLVVVAGCSSMDWRPLSDSHAQPDRGGEQASSKAELEKGGAPISQITDAESVSKGELAPKDYKIGPGDVLEITVFGEDSLNRKDLVVKPDGKVSFPLAGEIQVGGSTAMQAKEALEKALHEYIPDAVASVSVTQLGSLQYYVVGKVNKPGMYNVSKPLTVLQALAMAGGLTPFVDETGIIIVRDNGKETSRLNFNYRQIKQGRDLEENILLQRGDVVVAP